MNKRDIIAEKFIEMQEQLLLESRIDFIKKSFESGIKTDHDEFAEHKNTDAIVDHFSNNADPTKKKLYTQWIVNRYNEGDFRQEDHPRIHTALSNFEKYKQKLDSADIGKYKTLNDVENAVEPHLGTGTFKERRNQTNQR